MRQNSVQLIGYVGDTPRLKTFPTGSKRVTLRVATHYKIRTENEQPVFATDWHWVIAWGTIAEFAQRTFVKGSRILVEGSILYRKYQDSTGNERRITDIKANGLINLDR